MLAKSNPLIIPILHVLKIASADLSEHQLLGMLQRPLQAFNGFDKQPSLALFKRHFMLMNALYQLQQTVIEEGYHLSISPLNIALRPLCEIASTSIANKQDDLQLRNYYLDWQHFDNTSLQDVESLLDSFWQKFIAVDQQQAAFEVLGVSPGAEWPIVLKQYRRLAANKHPDRGGNAEEFVSLREAYEVLTRVYGQ